MSESGPGHRRLGDVEIFQLPATAKRLETCVGDPASLKTDRLESLKALDEFRFNDAAEFVWNEITQADLRIQETQPFKVVKENPEKGKAIIAELAVKVYRIARLVNPLMPTTSQTIKDAVKANKKPENLFARKE